MPEKHPLQAKYPDLQKSTAVELSAEQRRAGGERIPNEPGPKLEAWMSELEGYLEQIKSSDESYEGFKNLAGKAYITGIDDASVKLKIDRDAQIAENRGHGMAKDIKERAIEAKAAQIAQNQGRGLDEDIRERAIEAIIQETRETIQQDQESSLDDWIDYLASDDAIYPMWFKYYVFRNITKLSSFDKEKGEFPKRSRSTSAPFPDINREALAYMQDSLAKRYYNPEAEIDPETKKLLEKEVNFARLYKRCIDYAAPKTSENLNVTDGEWVKFDQSNDPEKAKKLANSLHGHGTGWCTAGEGMAQSQLAGGDFYVYYTKSDDGQYSVPRVAIRMQSGSIEEVRGIEADQNLEGALVPIAEAKMNEVDPEGAEAYKKKAEDMQRVTEIYARQQEGSELTEEDQRFIYELDGPIEGFGYAKDPRIEQIRQGRNIKADLSSLLDLPQEQISLTKDEALSGGIVYHYGYLNLSAHLSPEGLTLPTRVGGHLDLRNLFNSEGLILPARVDGGLNLLHLTSAEGLTLPDIVGGSINLRSLTSAEGLTFPTSVGRNLLLDSLTSAEGVTLPDSVGGYIDLSSLTSAEGLTLPDSMGGDLILRRLISAEGLTLPRRVGDGLYLSALTSAKGLNLPSIVGGNLDLYRLTSAKGLTLPQSMGGSLDLQSLTSAEGLKLPTRVGGSLDLNNLYSAEGLTLPQSVGLFISLAALSDEDKQRLREQRPDLADKIR